MLRRVNILSRAVYLLWDDLNHVLNSKSGYVYEFVIIAFSFCAVLNVFANPTVFNIVTALGIVPSSVVVIPLYIVFESLQRTKSRVRPKSRMELWRSYWRTAEWKIYTR